MFADSSNTAKLTVISVMSASQQCPSGLTYSSMTQANLLKVGVTLNGDLVYTPDWGFFIGAVMAFVAVILMSLVIVAYVYRKSWKTEASSGKDVEYQKKNYELVRIEDPEEPDSLISLNADSEAFYVLNQGKEVIRTREQLKMKRANEEYEKEQKAREKAQKGQTLELDQVEDLKDRLAKHMQEIRRLFGQDGASPEDEELDALPTQERDPDILNKRLIDQILRLKLLIHDNRKALDADQQSDSSDEEEGGLFEDKERDRREKERRLKEEADRLEREKQVQKA